MGKEEEFLKQIDEKIDKFRRESNKHKNLHRRFRYLIFSFAALTSVCSGLAIYTVSYQTEINILILVIGALTGLVTSLEGIRSPADLWVMERDVLYCLTDLKEDYLYQTAGESTVDTDKYHKRMLEILNSSKEKWLNDLQDDSAGSDESLGQTT